MPPPRRFASPPQGGDASRPAEPGRRHPRGGPARATGFTLVELLVAIAVLALMSVMSWRAIDGMNQAQSVTREHGEALAELQAALGQWVADLDAVQAQADFSAIDFDGRVLRLVRRDALDGEFRSAGLRVVAWTRHSTGGSTSGQWARWQSPPLRLRGELEQAWQRAAQWAEASREPLSGEVRLMPLAGWELFYYRGDAWTNPLSSAAAASTASTAPPLPDGVRLVLQLPAGGVLAGRLQRDWVRPDLARPRS